MRSDETALERAIRYGRKASLFARLKRNLVSTGIHWLRSDGDVGPVSETDFERVLGRYSDDPSVFVHAGLGDVKAAFDRNPYEFLRESLETHFENVFVPGFTPSFRRVDGRVYHKRYTSPYFGSFSRQFLADCDYRTNDATNSILVSGDRRFEECDHHDTWGENGCFAALDRENTLYLHVGTNVFRPSQIHYVEARADVPYVDPVEYEGVIYYDDTTVERITQRTDDETAMVENRAGVPIPIPSMMWNFRKLRDDLENADVLDAYDLDGLTVWAFHARELRRFLERRLADDLYYIVT